MDKNFTFSNYLIFLLFISTIFFHFLIKENIIIKETKNFIKKTELKNTEQLDKLKNKTINSELDFNDLIEIKQNYKNSKKNETLLTNSIPKADRNVSTEYIAY